MYVTEFIVKNFDDVSEVEDLKWPCVTHVPEFIHVTGSLISQNRSASSEITAGVAAQISVNSEQWVTLHECVSKQYWNYTAAALNNLVIEVSSYWMIISSLNLWKGSSSLFYSSFVLIFIYLVNESQKYCYKFHFLLVFHPECDVAIWYLLTE